MWNVCGEDRKKWMFAGVAVVLFLVFRFILPLIYPFLFGAVLATACLFAAPVAPLVGERIASAKKPWVIAACSVGASAGYILLFLLCIAAMVNSSYSPFLYFRF